MSRVVVLLGKDESGDFVDPISGAKLKCVAEGEPGVGELLEARLALREAGLVVRKGKSEVKLSQVRTLSNNTSGGELKPVLKQLQ